MHGLDMGDTTGLIGEQGGQIQLLAFVYDKERLGNSESDGTD